MSFASRQIGGALMSAVVSWVIIVGVTAAGATTIGVFGAILGLVLGIFIAGVVGDFMDMLPDKKQVAVDPISTVAMTTGNADISNASRKIIEDTVTSLFHLAANLQSRAQADELFPKEEIMTLASRLQDHAADLQLAASDLDK